MLRHHFKLALILLLSCFFFITPVSAQDTGWIISNFTSKITVNRDSSVNVEESISVDFRNLWKHGIYRNIPVVYRDKFGNRVNIRLRVNGVTDASGNKYKYITKRKGQDIEIKIGNPGKTVSGVQIYRIDYTLQRVINSFTDHDELYWNATGSEWPVPILKASALVTLPSQAKDTICFAGPKGSSLQNCSSQTVENTVQFFSQQAINPGEDFTIVAAIPKGAVEQPPLLTRIWWIIADNWIYSLPVITLIVLIYLYWQHGRDEQFKSIFDPSRGSERLPLFKTELIPSTYAPLKDLKPAEAGTLVDENINIRDIAATIVDLAVRGYLRIEEIKKRKFSKTGYRLIWLNKDLTDLKEYEKLLLQGIFKNGIDDTILLSELKYRFSTILKKVRDNLYDYLVKEGYFPKRPDKIVDIYRIVGIIIAIAGVVHFFSHLSIRSFAFIISGLLLLIFSKAMPRRTAFGRKHYLRVLGLKNFIALGAYREQLWERANLFEEVLPYAIALNLTHKWAEAFQDVAVPEPNWYTGSGSFSAGSFSHSMENFTRSTTETFTATRSSTGSSGFSGGSAGGGSGGGGGGSW